jgi:hypothetical protein
LDLLGSTVQKTVEYRGCTHTHVTVKEEMAGNSNIQMLERYIVEGRKIEWVLAL